MALLVHVSAVSIKFVHKGYSLSVASLVIAELF